MSKSTTLLDQLAYSDTFNCVQCGYCLPACPTYATMGKETHSPRGRINLVKMAAEGRLSLDELAEPIDLCLGCRACEPVCPTNVQYGKILASAVDVLAEHRRNQKSLKEKTVEKVVFDYTLPNQTLLNAMGTGLHLYQSMKLDKMVRGVKATAILPRSMREFEKIMPKVSRRSKRRPTSSRSEARPTFRIGYFTGCIMDTLFAHVNDLAIRLLQAAGCDVIVIKDQTCCGALHHHSGQKEKAIDLAKTNIKAFENQGFDYVINAIGGCGASLVEYPHLFDENDPWYPRAKAFAATCKDISFLLDQVELPFKREINKVVTYQPSCHLKNVQKIVQEPIRLIEKIPGVTFKPFPLMDRCCGSAGIYNLVHYEESMAILDQKMKNVTQVTPDVIVTTNPGCHLQMLKGVEQEGLKDQIQVVHLVELLAEACEIN